MINQGILVEAIITKLRAIDDLVALFGGENRISPYHYRVPRENSLARALHEMPTGGLLVAYRGTDPIGSREAEGWRHQFSIYIRSGRVAEDDDVTAGYYKIIEFLTNGVPAGGDGQRMLYTEIHPNCHSMDLPRIIGLSDVEAVDFFEFQFSLTEIGDT